MDFYEKIKSLLEEDNLDGFKELFYSFEGFQMIEDSSWDLASLFCDYLGKEKTEENKTIRKCLTEASVYLCSQFGNPKELFLIYLENAQTFLEKNDDADFFLLIDLIQTLLLRLSAKFIFYSLELAVNQFNKYLIKQETNTSDNERIIKLTYRYVHFLEQFIPNELQQNFQLKFYLTNILINLLSEPLLNIRLSKEEEASEQEEEEKNLENPNINYFKLIRRILFLISKLNVDFFKLTRELNKQIFSNRIKQEETGSIKPERKALASFVYFMFKNEELGLNKKFELPLVFSNLYKLNLILPILNGLLTPDVSEIGMEKALYTFSYVISKNNFKSLDENLFELNSIVESIQLLFRITVYSNYEQIRKKSVDILKLYFLKFDRSGRFSFLNYFLHDNYDDQTLNNYISSYLVYLFKEEVNECFDKNDQFYFNSKASKFSYLFKLIVTMRHGVQTDLIRESSKIIAILNMIRFMILKDSKTKLLGINQLLDSIDYLESLKKAIQITKAHYELENKNLESSSESIQENTEIEVTTLNNETIKEPTRKEKIKIIENALQSLDLIESLRCRVVELKAENLK